MAYFDIFGGLVYSPKRLGTHVSPNWWIIAQCDKEIGYYLRNLYAIRVFRTNKLIRSVWGEHVSIVRNEEPDNDKVAQYWEKYSGRNIQMRIFLEPTTDGHWWWLPAISEAACVIRTQLGLTRNPEIPFHLTFGRHDDETDKEDRISPIE
jgi:hypothetical protein